jgi:hypothetical protein
MSKHYNYVQSCRPPGGSFYNRFIPPMSIVLACIIILFQWKCLTWLASTWLNANILLNPSGEKPNSATTELEGIKAVKNSPIMSCTWLFQPASIWRLMPIAVWCMPPTVRKIKRCLILLFTYGSWCQFLDQIHTESRLWLWVSALIIQEPEQEPGTPVNPTCHKDRCNPPATKVNEGDIIKN